MFTLAILTAVAAAVRGLWSPCGLSMLSALNPMAERARGHRPAMTAAWYVLGAVVGGLLLGAVCAGFAWLVDIAQLSTSAAFGIAGAVAAITVLSDVRLTGWSLPDHPRQVNERWLSQFRRWVYAAGFGLQVGSGFATYVMTAATYLAAALAALAGPRDALLVGVVFGTVRGSEVLLGLWANAPDRLRRLMAGIERSGAASLVAVVVVQIGVAAAAVSRVGTGITGAAVGVVLSLVALVGALRRRRPAYITFRSLLQRT